MRHSERGLLRRWLAKSSAAALRMMCYMHRALRIRGILWPDGALPAVWRVRIFAPVCEGQGTTPMQQQAKHKWFWAAFPALLWVLFCVAVLLHLFWPSEDNYSKVKVGMTEKEVHRLVGDKWEPGLQGVAWQKSYGDSPRFCRPGRTRLLVVFRDGKAERVTLIEDTSPDERTVGQRLGHEYSYVRTRLLSW